MSKTTSDDIDQNPATGPSKTQKKASTSKAIEQQKAPPPKNEIPKAAARTDQPTNVGSSKEGEATETGSYLKTAFQVGTVAVGLLMAAGSVASRLQGLRSAQ